MENVRYVYLSERQETGEKGGAAVTVPYLELGEVKDFILARLISHAIRTTALATGNPDLVEYALELTRGVNEWAKKLPPDCPTDGPSPPPPPPSPILGTYR